ncbi:CTNNBL domain-containing protein [Pyrenophora tritici-repentis]|nr:CTNNBL domain-containing protein [Pyrenophora tritici-repentis]KAI0610202.1 CTNNBL domain-containing protein [Pyrenophora tritici-repentis]KAI0622148.1 CTNNBL domain-containing protein [Pyrenophora tritici-repentis]
MTSIDELFKSANGTTKRKFENPKEADPMQSYKSVKLSDDDEGRFFGDGLDENARDAMEYIDAKDGDEVIQDEKYDIPWVRKLALNFEKKVNKNASLRAKYEDDPTKFMDSEADLDEGIKALSILSEHPELYEEFATSTAAAKLVELLAHENTDIAIAAIEMISELTDEDVAGEQEQWDALVIAFMEADLLSLLISNFSRFDETDEADASGVYNSLSVIENLLSQPANTDIIGGQPALLKWLLDRIQKPESPTSRNKQYASEILSILTQSSRSNRNHIAEANGVEIFLTNLAPYRRDDPEKDSNEEEYMENLFNCLSSITEEPLGKTKFLEAEGVELCLLFIRDGKTNPSLIEHILSILSSLLRSLPGNSDARFRLLAKFLEKDCAKIYKLVLLRRTYVVRLAAFDAKMAERKRGLSVEEREELELQSVAERLSEGGLYCLERIDAVLAWLVAEDEGAKKAVVEALAERDEGLGDVKKTLQAQLDGVLEVEGAEREVLETLVGFLE